MAGKYLVFLSLVALQAALQGAVCAAYQLRFNPVKFELFETPSEAKPSPYQEGFMSYFTTKLSLSYFEPLESREPPAGALDVNSASEVSAAQPKDFEELVVTLARVETIIDENRKSFAQAVSHLNFQFNLSTTLEYLSENDINSAAKSYRPFDYKKSVTYAGIMPSDSSKSSEVKGINNPDGNPAAVNSEQQKFDDGHDHGMRYSGDLRDTFHDEVEFYVLVEVKFEKAQHAYYRSARVSILAEDGSADSMWEKTSVVSAVLPPLNLDGKVISSERKPSNLETYRRLHSPVVSKEAEETPDSGLFTVKALKLHRLAEEVRKLLSNGWFVSHLILNCAVLVAYMWKGWGSRDEPSLELPTHSVDSTSRISFCDLREELNEKCGVSNGHNTKEGSAGNGRVEYL